MLAYGAPYPPCMEHMLCHCHKTQLVTDLTATHHRHTKVGIHRPMAVTRRRNQDTGTRRFNKRRRKTNLRWFWVSGCWVELLAVCWSEIWFPMLVLTMLGMMPGLTMAVASISDEFFIWVFFWGSKILTDNLHHACLAALIVWNHVWILKWCKFYDLVLACDQDDDQYVIYSTVQPSTLYFMFYLSQVASDYLVCS